MNLRYTPEALAELDAVLDFIAERSPLGAHRVQARIQTILDVVARYPECGQTTSIADMRRIVATPYPYLVF